MTDINRYSWERFPGSDTLLPAIRDYGNWVLYEDHKSHLDRVEKERDEFKEWRETRINNIDLGVLDSLMNMPLVGQFWPGSTVQESEDQNWTYYKKERFKQIIIGYLSVMNKIGK